jgi:hypothetical protein
MTTNFFPPPTRRFGTVEPTFPNAFPGEALFKGPSTVLSTLYLVYESDRIVEKCFPGRRIRKRWFDRPTSSFGSINVRVTR